MKQRIKSIVLLILDCILINLSLYLAFWVRWDGVIPNHMLQFYFSVIPGITIGRIIIFSLFGLYKWSFRFASIIEAFNVVKAVASGNFIFICLMFFFDFRRFVGRAVPLIDFLLCLFFILSSRFLFRVFLQFSLKKRLEKNFKRVLVIGAGMTGETLVRELKSSKKTTYYPIGFIDDDPRKKKQIIHGVKVLGKIEKLTKLVNRYNIDEILIAIPSAPGKVIRNIISSCQKSNIKFKIIPGLQSILSGQMELKPIRDVNLEDLLGRKSVKIDDEEVKLYLKGQVILVTGAAGSIGSELVRQIADFMPKKILLFDLNENDMFFLGNELKDRFPTLQFKSIIGDIKDVSLLKRVFSKYQPDVVFHAAAHKHVPLMEENLSSAVKNNIVGTRNVIYASEHYGVNRFVLISTDKAVNPTSIMGVTKRITEMLCQAKASIGKTKFMAVRFGNVIGSNGSVVQVFKKQIRAKKDLYVTHPDIKRYFMTVSEAVQLVLQAGSMGEGGEIFILDMGEQMKIIDLAKNLISLSGLEVDKDISIKISGLRPGEKLYEEMLLDSEQDAPTRHEKIYKARAETFNIKELNKNIDNLRLMAKLMKNCEILQKIKEMVPNFNHTLNDITK